MKELDHKAVPVLFHEGARSQSGARFYFMKELDHKAMFYFMKELDHKAVPVFYFMKELDHKAMPVLLHEGARSQSVRRQVPHRTRNHLPSERRSQRVGRQTHSTTGNYLKMSQRIGRQTHSTTGNHLKMSQRVGRQTHSTTGNHLKMSQRVGRQTHSTTGNLLNLLTTRRQTRTGNHLISERSHNVKAWEPFSMETVWKPL